MWLLRSTGEQPAVLFHYASSRSGDVAKHLLDGFAGALMVDGYEGYHAVCAQQGLLRRGCWAHARRKFIEAQKAQAQHNTGKADQALAWIQALYRIEQTAKDQPHEARLLLRQSQARVIIDKMRTWLGRTPCWVKPYSNGRTWCNTFTIGVIRSTTTRPRMPFACSGLAEKTGCSQPVKMARRRARICTA